MTTAIRNGRYRHYKGGEYLVIGEALHTETEETLVLYHSIRDGVPSVVVFARPSAMFGQLVTVDGVVVPRFAALDDPAELA
jgi:hypothetical protein